MLTILLCAKASLPGGGAAGAGGSVVAFKPREWRGARGGGKDELNATAMAAELGSDPAGTVTAIYVTSDGGGDLAMLYDLVAALPPHVRVVDANALAGLAMEKMHATAPSA